MVHAAAPLTGEPALDYARALASCFNGQVVDARHGPIDTALQAAPATMRVAAMPRPQSGVWLSNCGEPLIRHGAVPILFVPENL